MARNASSSQHCVAHKRRGNAIGEVRMASNMKRIHQRSYCMSARWPLVQWAEVQWRVLLTFFFLFKDFEFHYHSVQIPSSLNLLL